MGEAGVIRFVRMACFLDFGSSLFVREATISGTFNRKLHMIRFVGLPFAFTSGERGKSVGEAGVIRFVRMTCFLELDNSFSYVR